MVGSYGGIEPSMHTYAGPTPLCNQDANVSVMDYVRQRFITLRANETALELFRKELGGDLSCEELEKMDFSLVISNLEMVVRRIVCISETLRRIHGTTLPDAFPPVRTVFQDDMFDRFVKFSKSFCVCDVIVNLRVSSFNTLDAPYPKGNSLDPAVIEQELSSIFNREMEKGREIPLEIRQKVVDMHVRFRKMLSITAELYDVMKASSRDLFPAEKEEGISKVISLGERGIEWLKDEENRKLLTVFRGFGLLPKEVERCPNLIKISLRESQAFGHVIPKQLPELLSFYLS
jgi:hypothetical protein